MKKHWVALLLAVLVGILHIAPDLKLMTEHGYAGIPLVYTDAEPWYLTRIEGVYKGCAVSCNPYIKEYGSTFPFFDASISETVLAFPGIALGIPVATLKIIYLFLLPALLFFLVYLLLWRLTKGKVVSILGAAIVLLGFNLINSQIIIDIPALLDIFRWKTNQVQFLFYSRPVNPEFSSVYFFIFLHTFLTALETKTKKSYLMLGLLYGVSFYVYFFTYAFISVMLVVALAAYAVSRDWKTVRNYAFVIVGGILIGSYQILEILKLFKHPYFFTIPSQYLVRTHVPDISIIGVLLFITFAVLVWVEYQKGRTPSLLFIALLGLSVFLARNEHVVTGMVMQYNHFEASYFTPALVVVSCYFLHIYFSQKNTWIIGILTALFFANGIVVQQTSYLYWRDFALKSQKYAPLISWLNSLPKGQVIAAADPTASLVPAFTPHYVYWSFYAGQWMSVPGRAVEEPHGVNYYIEDTMRDKLAKSNLQKVYSDEYFTVYHNQ